MLLTEVHCLHAEHLPLQQIIENFFSTLCALWFVRKETMSHYTELVLHFVCSMVCKKGDDDVIISLHSIKGQSLYLMCSFMNDNV